MAVEKAFELSLTVKSMNSKKNNKMKSYPRFAGLFGHEFSAFQLDETGNAVLGEAQLDAAEAALVLLHDAADVIPENSVVEELQNQIVQFIIDNAIIIATKRIKEG